MAETKTTTPATAATPAKPVAATAAAKPAETKAETKTAAPAVKAEAPKAAPAAKKAVPVKKKAKTATKKTAAKKAATPKKAVKKATKKVAKKVTKKTTAKKVAAKTAAPKKAATGQTTVKQTTSRTATQVFGGDIQTMEQIMTTTQEQIEKAAKGAFVQFDQIAELQKKQYDALVKSSTIFVKGVEELGQNFADFTKYAMEKGAANSKTLLGCKTLNELAEVQSGFAQESFEDLVSQATKLSELSAKITSDAFEPLNDQINETMKTLGTKLAA